MSESDKSQTKSSSKIGVVLIGAGAVAGVVIAYFVLTGPDAPDPDSQNAWDQSQSTVEEMHDSTDGGEESAQSGGVSDETGGTSGSAGAGSTQSN